MNAATPLRSLTRQTLLQMAVRIAIVVVIATIIAYFHVSNSLQAQALEQLREYIQQRGVRESAIFSLAKDNLRSFAQEYAKRLESIGSADPQARFAELFAEREDGSIRLRENFFTSDSVTGVIGKYVTIDADLRRRLVIGFEMLAQYGPAWQNRFVNLYVTTPESAILIFWPNKPWGLNANSWEVGAKLALNTPGEDMVFVTDDSQRPQEATWSDLYFDYAVNDWMVSTTEPVNLDGKYRISVGHDVLLHELIERTINNHLEGTYNILFCEDGNLMAHPRFMDAIQSQNGGLPIAAAGDANLLRIFNLVKQSATNSAILDNSEDKEYLAVTQLQGSGWYLVTVYPKTIIAARAFKAARLVLILGAIALLLEIATSFFVLRRQIAKPLTSLMEATNRIAAGDFNIALGERRPDEIGQLARSFNTMSREIGARQSALNERSAKLALLNQQLAQELEERKRAEQEIVRQREALHQSEKLQALGSLLAGVAHELNNPLSVVVGRTIMLESEASDPTLKTRLTKIRQAAERCARIVKTFLAIARQQPPERKPVQVNALLEAALELVDYGLRTADIATTLDLDPAQPEICADADQLTQVFTNLIINAQQALLEMTTLRRLVITTRFAPDTRCVRIAFTDNGPGIPEAIRSRIFEPFYTSKPVGIGTGIGLSFSYGVITAHDGAISLEAPPQGGTRFVITLPLATTIQTPAANAMLQAAISQSKAILIVDDEPDIADLLRELLAPEGHQINTAASGNEALQRLQQHSYDVIFCDLKMPDLDGPGLYKRLQQSHPHLLERIIFISGDTLRRSASAFITQTGRPLIEKPFIPSEVIQQVRQVLSQCN